MSEVAMTIIDPGGQRWAQLLDISQPTRELLPLVVGRLALPEQLNYELRHVRTGLKLVERHSPQASGVDPGEELLVKPVRNSLLMDFLEALYREAAGCVTKQLWEQAGPRIETIFRLEPDYPDPQDLRRVLEKHPPPSGLGGEPARSVPAGSLASSPGSAAVQPTSGQVAKAPTKSRSGCVVVGIIVGVVILLFLVVAAVGLFVFLQRAVNEAPANVPFLDRGDEPLLGTGDVQVTLRWNNGADLDLHVVDPSGEEIWYSSPISESGGQLDVDANLDCSGDPPVENIFWPTGGAPAGTYEVEVVYYGPCDTTGPIDYEVTILVDGQTIDVQSGTLTDEGESQFIGEFAR